MQANLSIVIPVGPGDEEWRGLLPLLDDWPGDAEILISACAPAPDDWPDIRCTKTPIRWLTSKPGRAGQLNHGIERSRARSIWLLHADSRPDAANIRAARNQARSEDQRWHYFDLAFGHSRPGLTRLNAIGANLRSRIAGLPFGDQGWLLTRSTFDRVGPFDPDWSSGEDLEWVLRARRHGVRPWPIGQRLATSARRYIEHGWLRTTLDHQIRMWRMIHAAHRQHREQP